MTEPTWLEEAYRDELERNVLALREALVRHDENLAAHDLLSRSVPYFLKDRPAIRQALADQREMVLHLLEPEAYAEYYATNPHERCFEEQYGIAPERAHEYMHRVQFLRDGLTAQRAELGPMPALSVLDLSANDGWMAVNLGQLGYVVDCVDLHPGNCKIARERKQAHSSIGRVVCGDLHDTAWTKGKQWDAVVCFETLEHVADPANTLDVMRQLCAPKGRLYVSTPFEAIERGNLPSWDHVERKGHVRVFRRQDLVELLEPVGVIDRLEVGRDGVMAAAVTPVD